jgi:hypothetical protein
MENTMNSEEKDVKGLFELEDTELLRLIGFSALSEGFGAAETTDEEAEEEGRRIVEQLKPVKPEGLCSQPVVRAFIADANVELWEVVSVVGDVICNMILPIPPVTLTVAFIRFGLRKYCRQYAE